MENARGKAMAGGLIGLVAWRAMSQSQRQRVLRLLEQVADSVLVAAEKSRQAELAQQAAERQRQAELAQQAAERQRQIELAQRETAARTAPPAPAPPHTAPAAPSSVPTVAKVASEIGYPLDTDSRWLSAIEHPSVVLLLGKRGSGKSALGYRLLELFRYVARPYVVGVPSTARALLPDWIGIAPDLETVPPKAIVLVDEAYLHYHARGSMAQESMVMSQAVNLSRQREQTLVFVSQEARQVDRNISSSASVVVFKDLGMLQLEFDRREFNKLAEQAKAAFAAVRGDKRRHGFVYAPDSDFLGMMENELPSFWRPRLSKLFAADAAPAASRPPKRMTPREKAVKAMEMRAAGASYKEIAEALGVTKGTVVNYLTDYKYKRRGTSP